MAFVLTIMSVCYWRQYEQSPFFGHASVCLLFDDTVRVKNVKVFDWKIMHINNLYDIIYVPIQSNMAFCFSRSFDHVNSFILCSFKTCIFFSQLKSFTLHTPTRMFPEVFLLSFYFLRVIFPSPGFDVISIITSVVFHITNIDASSRSILLRIFLVLCFRFGNSIEWW